AKQGLTPYDVYRLKFHAVKNENLVNDLSICRKTERSRLEGRFDFVFGVNTIRYCRDAGTELDCARDILNLLTPGGVCVVIDMNNRFPLSEAVWRIDFAGKGRGVLCPVLGGVRRTIYQGGI